MYAKKSSRNPNCSDAFNKMLIPTYSYSWFKVLLVDTGKKFAKDLPDLSRQERKEHMKIRKLLLTAWDT